jgi:hypothetical protein
MNTTEAEQVTSGNNTSDVYPIGASFKSQLGQDEVIQGFPCKYQHSTLK